VTGLGFAVSCLPGTLASNVPSLEFGCCWDVTAAHQKEKKEREKRRKKRRKKKLVNTNKQGRRKNDVKNLMVMTKKQPMVLSFQRQAVIFPEQEGRRKYDRPLTWWACQEIQPQQGDHRPC